MKYEYKIRESYVYLDEKELNELGAEGWRLVTVIEDQRDPVRYVFMKEEN